jgi:hypothetical protein
MLLQQTPPELELQQIPDTLIKKKRTGLLKKKTHFYLLPRHFVVTEVMQQRSQ